MEEEEEEEEADDGEGKDGENDNWALRDRMRAAQQSTIRNGLAALDDNGTMTKAAEDQKNLVLGVMQPIQP